VKAENAIKDKGVVLFVDFDGTITKKDTCAAMVESFAGEGWREINERWERKEISTEQCANLTFNLFQADLEDMKKLMDTMEIDVYFKEFLRLCRDRAYGIYVLSDGYDFCIENVFGRYDIEIPYYANRMVYDQGFKIECSGANPDCGICGTCKTRLIEELKGKGKLVVYVGDGYSDTCPAAKADVVFAKKELYRFCRDNGISARYFDTFNDVILFLSSLD
jgi:2-hydroxy-3-keto-5-methylthiopentenyl-1-phosphate phosphatase